MEPKSIKCGASLDTCNYKHDKKPNVGMARKPVYSNYKFILFVHATDGL